MNVGGPECPTPAFAGLLVVLSLACVSAFAAAIAPVPPTDTTNVLYCSDRYGNRVLNGAEYIPEEDPCKKCLCEYGFPVMCRTAMCSPPECEMFETLKNECCEFRCINPSLDVPKSNKNGTDHRPNAGGVNLSIRLVASAITSLLIIALLVFMIHRLRQRRLLINMRRFNNSRNVDDTLAYMTNIDQLDIGFEFPPYEDPPPPYSPPKAHTDDPTDAPPPYEVSAGQPSEAEGQEVNSALVNATGEPPTFTTEAAIGVDGGTTRAAWRVDLLRPWSAVESLNSELVELNQLNPNFKSSITLSSPALASRRNRRDGRSFPDKLQKHAFVLSLSKRRKHSDQGSLQKKANDTISALNQSLLKQLVCDQNVNTNSLSSQSLMRRKDNVAESSFLYNALERNSRDKENQRKEDQSKQTESVRSLSQERPITPSACNQLSSSCLETDLDQTGVKHPELNFARMDDDPMQRSTPEVSMHFTPCHSACKFCSNDRRSGSSAKTKAGKSKSFLFSNLLLKNSKQKLNPRPQSCCEPNYNSSSLPSSESVRRSLQPLDLKADFHSIPVVIKKPSSEQLTHFSLHPLNNTLPVETHSERNLAQVKFGNVISEVHSCDLVDFNSISLPENSNETGADSKSSIEDAVVLQSPGLLSPDLPVRQQFLRSESMTSEVSGISICSETGEDKHTKRKLPKASKATMAVTPKNVIDDTLAPESKVPHNVNIGNCPSRLGLHVSGNYGGIVSSERNFDHFKDLRLISSSALSLAEENSGTPSLAAHSSNGENYEQECHSKRKCYSLPSKEKETKALNGNLDCSLLAAVKTGQQSLSVRPLSLSELPMSDMVARQPDPQWYDSETEGHSMTDFIFCSSDDVRNPDQAASHLKDKTTDKSEQGLAFRDRRESHSCSVHCCNKCKRHSDIGRRPQFRRLESFEHLVNQILKQLETTNLDDFVVHQSVVEKSVNRNVVDGDSECQSTDSGYISCKDVVKQD